MEEMDVVLRAKDGDLKAFEELVVLYKKRVYSFAYYHLRNRADAEDISQEVFWRVFNYIKKFDHNRKFFSWLYAIEMNVIKTFAMKKKSRGKTLEDMDVEAIQFYDKGLLSADDKIVLFEEIDKLEELEKNLLFLKYMDDRSIKEIAEDCKLSEENVKVKLFRIKEKLAKNIQEAENVKTEFN